MTLQDWLNGAVEFRGRGAGKPVAIAVTEGTVDIRKMPGAEKRKASAWAVISKQPMCGVKNKTP